MENTYNKEKYLKQLSKEYKNISEVTEEIINLKAILNLPKGTEVFLSDIHGEYEPFVHILNNGAGIIKSKINALYEDKLSEKEKATLATLIYYPEEKLELIKKEIEDINEWYSIVLYRLIEVAHTTSSKYTRSKVRKAINKGFGYIIDELLHAQGNENDKKVYYKEIIKTIIDLGRAEEFIIALSDLIKRMAIDHLHIIGDVFDRGSQPNLVIESLMNFHSLDFQWGNHDLLWMGASLGNKLNIANVIRICARYDNIRLLEEGYGINIRPLSTFASEVYKDDPCAKFLPYAFDENKYYKSDKIIVSKIHKAITIIQFKLEAEYIARHPEYQMENRLLLDKINFETGEISINNKTYKLNDTNFPTIIKGDVYKLTKQEEELMERLVISFTSSETLKRHMDFIFSKGSMYTIFNDNLLFHGCVPMTENGDFEEINILGKSVKGKAYFDHIQEAINNLYLSNPKNEEFLDFTWFLWASPKSPLFGKEKMGTFEHYFIDDKETHREPKNPYYEFIDDESTCIKVLNEFGLFSDESHIINGHVPVKVKNGETPIKANGKLLIIDGGFAKSFRENTGNAGYILSYNSHGLLLCQNKPFESIQNAIIDEKDIISEIIVEEHERKRKTVRDTDIGKKLLTEIADLEELLNFYKLGYIKEK